MTDFSKLLETSARLPWEAMGLGGLLLTTSLTGFWSWQISRQMKDITMKTMDIDDPITIDAIPSEMHAVEISSPYVWHVHGASRVGKVRSENQDAFVYIQESPSQWFLAVYDGAGGIKGGREAAQSATDVCRHVMEETTDSDLSSEERLLLAISEARHVAESTEQMGITTAILAYVDGNTLTYATLGDGGLSAVWPDGMISHLLVPHHILGQPDNIIAGYIGKGCEVPPRTGSVKLEPGTTLMLMSDGASDLFPYDDFAQKRAEFGEFLKSDDNQLSDHLLKQTEEARDSETNAYLHSDNMTLVMAYMSEADHA